MTPTMGRIVIFKITAEQAEQVNRRRTNGGSIAERMKRFDLSPPILGGREGNIRVADQIWPTGAQAHIGYVVIAGAEFPMMIVRVWADNDHAPACVNGQVFLDGNDVFWATAIPEGDQEGQWHWPERMQ